MGSAKETKMGPNELKGFLNKIKSPRAPATGGTGAPSSSADLIPPPSSSADELKDKGNTLFKAGRYEDAIRSYTSSIAKSPSCIAYANRAMAYLKLNRHDDAIRDCTGALNLDPSYVKALQRRGTAKKALKDFASAAEDFELALRYEPTNKQAADERQSCLTALYEQHPELLHQINSIKIPIKNIERDEGIAIGETVDVQLTESHTRRLNTEKSSSQKTVKVSEAVVQPAARDDESPPPLTSLHIDKSGPMISEIETSSSATENTCTKKDTVEAIAAKQTESLKNQTVKADVQQLDTAAAAVVERLKSSDVLLKPPKNGVEFEKAWKGFKNDATLQARYLANIQPSQLPILLKQALTPVLLAAILYTVLKNMCHDEIECGQAVEILLVLPDVPRFDVNILSLSSAVKKELKEAWDAFEKHVGGTDSSSLLSKQLLEARGRYKL